MTRDTATRDTAARDRTTGHAATGETPPGGIVAGTSMGLGRKRIACLDDGSAASAGLFRLLASVDRFEVVDTVDEDVDLVVLLLRKEEDAQLLPIIELAEVSPLMVVGPVDYAADALKAGAKAYATPGSAASDLLGVVHAALGGRRALTQDATEYLIGNTTERPLRAEDLSPRQVDILRLLVAGEPIGAIGIRLGVSRQAVGQALERMRRRAGVESNRALARFTRDRRLLDGH